MAHDLVIVGGGLGGTPLGASMARSGARVLILERAKQFHDRVRGEGMHPWGVPELHALNLYDKLLKTCARQVPYRMDYRGSTLIRERDLIETTPQRSGAVDFYHPQMQEVLLQEATDASVEVQRGVAVTKAIGGGAPAVIASIDGAEQRFPARLVVGADGRQSVVRRDGKFKVSRDPDWLRISGALFEGMGAPENAVHVFAAPNFGHVSLLFPIGGERVRAYFPTGRRAEHRALSGPADVSDFCNYSADTGVPREWLDRAHLVGPLATFEGADVWVDHPYNHGLVLVGDAAAANDPCWGCGLSMTLRDVRVLRDALLANDDWDAACRRYAAEHDRYYGALHRITSWLRAVRFTVGPEGDQLREHALPRLADGTGPDLWVWGQTTLRMRLLDFVFWVIGAVKVDVQLSAAVGAPISVVVLCERVAGAPLSRRVSPQRRDTTRSGIDVGRQCRIIGRCSPSSRRSFSQNYSMRHSARTTMHSQSCRSS